MRRGPSENKTGIQIDVCKELRMMPGTVSTWVRACCESKNSLEHLTSGIFLFWGGLQGVGD